MSASSASNTTLIWVPLAGGRISNDTCLPLAGSIWSGIFIFFIVG
jgi:hypothetical protein